MFDNSQAFAEYLVVYKRAIRDDARDSLTGSLSATVFGPIFLNNLFPLLFIGWFYKRPTGKTGQRTGASQTRFLVLSRRNRKISYYQVFIGFLHAALSDDKSKCRLGMFNRMSVL